MESEADLSVLSPGEMQFTMEEELERAGLGAMPNLHTGEDTNDEDNFGISPAIGVSSRQKLFDLRNQIIDSNTRSIDAMGTGRR